MEFNSQTDNKNYHSEKETLENKNRSLVASFEQLNLEMTDQKSKYDALQKDNEEILKKYERLLEQNRTVLNSASTEKEELYSQLIKQNKVLEQKENKQKELDLELKRKAGELDNAAKELDAKVKKINDLQSIIDLQNRKSQELQSNLSAALKGFSDTDLSVRESNGKVYVSLSQNLLFASGSDKIDPKGQNAVKQLAAILAQNQDIDILVEGHTDNTGTPELNWDLSTNRSLAIVKILTANKIDGKRITAAGRGMYSPIQANDTPLNRSLNRRTEIILAPKLDELYKLLK
jgi:chemotaxis protein MotB